MSIQPSARTGRPPRNFRPDWRTAAGVAAVALTAAAVFNWRSAAAAERRNPPLGRFLTVDGVRLHHVDRGEGPPIVLLHGNGSMVEDWVTSGVLDGLAEQHRVLAFDRPGYGHSARPRRRVWTPEAQADLVAHALDRISVPDAVVVGHSWGAMVAMALAQRHPARVSQLVLVSGYYFPSVRLDVLLMSGPAVPGIGDIVRHTISPPLTRLVWPALMRKMFGPKDVPAKFHRFPREMAWRPSQIRASAEETALMIPAAFRLSKKYKDLAVPTLIVAADGDRIVSFERQSRRLHGTIAHSRLRQVSGHGHMVHQTATADVLDAILDVLPKSG